VPALTRDRILQTAVRIADRSGPDAVTLRRIAAELHVHVTSLYNHVPTREAVTDGIVEVLLDEAKLPMANPTAPISWETWVRRFFDAMGTIAATHPGAFTALQQRPVQGPRATASFEVALDAFVHAGFTPAEAYGAVKTVALLAVIVGVERSMVARGEMPETHLDDLPADAFPMTRSIAPVGVPEEAWDFSLETLIAGLRAQLGRSQRAQRATVDRDHDPGQVRRGRR
jgi:AcrR family transcriptional regulator